MNVKILISISIVVVLSITFLAFTTSESTTESIPEPNYEIDFVYSDIDKIKKILATQNLILSVSTAITDNTVSQYCTYFDDNVQKFVKYCTTAALLDSGGKPFGNINMGGNSDDSTMALAIIEVPTLDFRENEIDFVFQTMIETLVCDCWEELQPGGFESVSLWLNTAKEKYVESSQTTLKSNISGLDEKQIFLEITSTEKSYLWTLVIVK